MKILSAQQIKAWDKYTIENEPISSSRLMERASNAFVDKFTTLYPNRDKPLLIICGNGNNGGDGLVVGRLLMLNMYDVTIYKLQLTPKDSEDFALQWQKNQAYENLKMFTIKDSQLNTPDNAIFIDAILGTGLTRPVEGWIKELIIKLNNISSLIVSIDIPSGLPSDKIVQGVAIKAHKTITFQIPKYSFFLKENVTYVSDWETINIGLDTSFSELSSCPKTYVTKEIAQSLYRTRDKFGHKGDFGTAHLVVGSKSMLGAGILSSKAALKSGAGLVKTIVPKSLKVPIMACIPEVMTLGRKELKFVDFSDNKNVLGVGCGLSVNSKAVKMMDFILEHVNKTIVIDADGLNIISQQNWLNRIPSKSIITPHLKEFHRLFGITKTSLETYQLAQEMSFLHQIIIVLKGAYTHTFMPNGEIYINSTGNVGMATAGSGDVLTGIITSLLAQKYTPKEATILGVYLHGLAGDKALKRQSCESLSASDIIDHLGAAYKELVL